jgi:ribosome biogenesis GTPase A
MVTAKKEIEDDIKLIDIVIEVLDARIPISSQNPNVQELVKNKEKIILLNKYDLADMEKVNSWKNKFESENSTVILSNASSGENISTIINTIKKLGQKKYANKDMNKSVEINHIYRVLVIGIPNVGKSTLINKLAKRDAVNVKNMPGVTRKKQWIRIDDNIELLDTPGLLWPKLDDENAGVKLALTGNIKQEIIDIEELAIEGVKFLLQNVKYKKMLSEKYDIKNIDNIINKYNNDTSDDAYFETTKEIEIINLIGKRRGCLIKGGEIDFSKASKIFLDDFKNGKIGRISLE